MMNSSVVGKSNRQFPGNAQTPTRPYWFLLLLVAFAGGCAMQRMPESWNEFSAGGGKVVELEEQVVENPVGCVIQIRNENRRLFAARYGNTVSYVKLVLDATNGPSISVKALLNLEYKYSRVYETFIKADDRTVKSALTFEAKHGLAVWVSWTNDGETTVSQFVGDGRFFTETFKIPGFRADRILLEVSAIDGGISCDTTDPFVAFPFAVGHAFAGSLQLALPYLDRTVEASEEVFDSSTRNVLLMMRALAYAERGNLNEARSNYENIRGRRAPVILNELAWALVQLEGPEIQHFALEVAVTAVDIDRRKTSVILDTLAVAYAANGRFAKAIATQQEAIEKLKRKTDPATQERMKDRLRKYEGGSPAFDIRCRRKSMDLITMTELVDNFGGFHWLDCWAS